MSKHIVTKAFLKENNLSIEFKACNDGWYCTLSFDENYSYYILSKTTSNNPAIKDPKQLIGQKFDLLEHPAGGTLAPIALRINNEWIYKKKGDWCRWM